MELEARQAVQWMFYLLAQTQTRGPHCSNTLIFFPLERTCLPVLCQVGCQSSVHICSFSLFHWQRMGLLKHLRTGAPAAAAVEIVCVRTGIKTRAPRKQGEKDVRLNFKAGSEKMPFFLFLTNAHRSFTEEKPRLGQFTWARNVVKQVSVRAHMCIFMWAFHIW